MIYSIYTSKDKESYRIIIVASWAAIFIAFMFRSEGIGIFNGNLQYAGLILLFLGIVLREWFIWILGKNFTVRVQVRENARLITQGPYKYIIHPIR
jgi:protein-S-isoprenylcysteine O-methyltransferase Ste14